MKSIYKMPPRKEVTECILAGCFLTMMTGLVLIFLGAIGWLIWFIIAFS